MPPKPAQQPQQQPPQQQQVQAKTQQQTQQSPVKQVQQQSQQASNTKQQQIQQPNDPKNTKSQKQLPPQSPSKSPVKQPPFKTEEKKQPEQQLALRQVNQDPNKLTHQQLLTIDKSYVITKLKAIINASMDQDKVKQFSQSLIQEHNEKYIKKLVRADHLLNDDPYRNLEPYLSKERLKLRKQEFHDKIEQLNIKDFLTKQQIQSKLKLLEENEKLLAKKDGDKEVENLLGIKLTGKYHTIAIFDENARLSPSPSKQEKSYNERRYEREAEELKQKEEVDILLTKIKEEKRERKEKKKREMRERMNEMKRQEEQKEKRMKDREMQEIEEKRKKIQTNIHKIKEDRETSIQQMLQEVKRVQKNPMFKQIELKYKEEEETEIEKRKKHLQSIRDLNVPLTREEIQEHSKKMEELVKEKVEQRRHSRLARMAISYDYSQYQTKFLDNIMEQEAAIREEKERKEEEKKRVCEQKDVYDRYVKEMHWPKVSEKKKFELEQLKQVIRTSPQRRKSPGSIMERESRNDDVLSGKYHPFRAASEIHEGDSSIRKIVWKENPLKPKPIDKREGKIVDYLKEQRLKKDQDIKDGVYPMTQSHDWKKEISKIRLNGRDRYELVLDKAKNFEEKAKRKQLLINAGKTNNIEDIMELNDMYVESIKAKLELLNDIDKKN